MINMFNKMKIIAFGVILLLCISCNSSKINSLDNVPIEEFYIDNFDQDYLTTDEYVVDKVIELKMPEDLDVVMCDRLLFEKDRVYILDKRSRKVYVFNNQGDIISAIGRIGHAANELAHEPTDFAVDTETGEIYIFEQYTARILKYDEQGNHISTERFSEIAPHLFARQKDGKYVFSFTAIKNSLPQTPEFAVYDDDFDFVNGFLPLENNHVLFTGQAFNQYYDKVAYIPNLSEYIYILDADTIASGIHFSFETPYIAQEIRNKIKYTADIDLFSSNSATIHSLDQFYENEHYRYLKYCIAYHIFHYIQNKKTGNVYNGPYLFNDIFPFSKIGLSGNKVVFLATIEDVDRCLSQKDQETPEVWKEIVESSNPEIQKLMTGELKAPCLIYVSFP